MTIVAEVSTVDESSQVCETPKRSMDSKMQEFSEVMCGKYGVTMRDIDLDAAYDALHAGPGSPTPEGYADFLASEMGLQRVQDAAPAVAPQPRHKARSLASFILSLKMVGLTGSEVGYPEVGKHLGISGNTAKNIAQGRHVPNARTLAKILRKYPDVERCVAVEKKAKPVPKTSFGIKLDEARIASGLTRPQFCAKHGIAYANYYAFMRGGMPHKQHVIDGLERVVPGISSLIRKPKFGGKKLINHVTRGDAVKSSTTGEYTISKIQSGGPGPDEERSEAWPLSEMKVGQWFDLEAKDTRMIHKLQCRSSGFFRKHRHLGKAFRTRQLLRDDNKHVLRVWRVA